MKPLNASTHGRTNPMTEPQPSGIDPEMTAAFLSSIERRLADLDGVAATCPFDPMAVAGTFIAMMQHPPASFKSAAPTPVR
jgi:hypothetical protein